MIGRNNRKTETAVDIDIESSQIQNSYVGCNITNNIDFLDISINNVFKEIFNEIKEIDDDEIKEQLEKYCYNIKKLYKDSKEKFLKLANISSCSLEEVPKENQIQNIIKFWIVAKYFDNKIDMEKVADSLGKFNFDGNDSWFFTPSNSTTRSIEKCIAAIKHYLKVEDDMDSLKNGNCYISRITPTKEFSCNKCKDGYIILGNVDGIIEDFVDGKKNIVNLKDTALQRDFINIQVARQLKMKCGNCISDLEQVPGNVQILKK
ncbi:hypothetical protein [Clostridium beijerinckii]|uniref:hypothetical protein n=1 Tax=Clostridium beijerinckii TaxID=1520 RepID=UPI000809B1CB|nr:hypothetical protein [Clostridium beijerinckii]OCB00426.1 hypothetical protein BGS1_15920 [Clostridium beijerinckii]